MSEQPVRRVSFLDDYESTRRLHSAEACLSMLQNGTYFVKIRPRGHYPRLFQLEDNFNYLIWSPSSKNGRVVVSEINELRFGRNSPRLLDSELEIDGHVAFTLVHGPDNLFVDLVADSEEEATVWVACLSFLSKLKATKPPDECVLGEFMEFAKTLCAGRPEIGFLITKYGNGLHITAEELRYFLLIEQNMPVSGAKCALLIQEFEPDEGMKEKTLMTAKGLAALLLSKHGDIFNYEKSVVYQDMTRPLSHYFISSSHNSFLSSSQSDGYVSLGALHRTLCRGCRYIELDLWEGPKKSPVVRHRRCTGEPLELSPVSKLIGTYAFTASEYPLIVRIEHHCSLQQQKRAAAVFRHYLSAFLLDMDITDQSRDQLPSPEELKRKIILVTKTLSRECGDGDGFVSEDDDMFEPLSYGEIVRKLPKRRRSALSIDSFALPVSESTSLDLKMVNSGAGGCKPSLPILSANELSKLSSCLCLRSFAESKLNDAPDHRHLWSFSSKYLGSLSTSKYEPLVTRHQTCISRAYPAFSEHKDSSNYAPTIAWACGVQCVALNWQTICTEMDIMMSLFSDNGACGYILKPPVLTQGVASANLLPGIVPLDLTIKVISAQSLPDPFLAEFRTDVLDPCVRVTVHGAPGDEANFKTRPCRNSRERPRWDESFSCKIRFPDVAQLRFHVIDADSIGSDFIGQFTVPARCLCTGYRHIGLKTPDDLLIPGTSLFVHITCNKASGYSNFGKLCTKRARKEALTCHLTTVQDLDVHFKKFNSLLSRVVDLFYPAEASLVDVKLACAMGSSASLKDCMRALAVHSRKGKKPACKLIVCDHLPLTFVPINGELSEFVHRAVSVLNNSMKTISSCGQQFESFVTEMKDLKLESSSKFANVDEVVERAGLTNRQLKKAQTAFHWNMGLLKMEAEEVKDTMNRLKLSVQLSSFPQREKCSPCYHTTLGIHQHIYCVRLSVVDSSVPVLAQE